MLVKCTSCGALQNASTSQECSYCGNQFEIEQAKSNYEKSAQSETGNMMGMAETSLEATNYEEALSYFNRVLEKEFTNSDAWLGKGIAIVYTSKIGDLKITEAIAYWKSALKNADNQQAMGKRIAKEINTVVNAFYPTLENHFIEYKDLANSYQELVSKFATLEKALDFATQNDAHNIDLFYTGFNLCKRVTVIPRRYALVDQNSAFIKGAVAIAQNNRYQQRDAIEQSQRAGARKREIQGAYKVIVEIERKYYDNVKKLDESASIQGSWENNNKNSISNNAVSGKKDIKWYKRDLIMIPLCMLILFILLYFYLRS